MSHYKENRIFVKKNLRVCVSKGIMSPLTAKVKCPHYGGQTNFEPEAVTEVASHEDGGRREDQLEGGKGEDNMSYRQTKRIQRALREKGIKGLIHGNRGRPSHRRVSEWLRQKVFPMTRILQRFFERRMRFV
jgi:hypothetical protein